MASASDRPIADHSEKRPPTQSQNSKTLAAGMPNCSVSSRLVEQGDEMIGDGAFPAGRGEQPGAGGAGVGQRLLGGEGLAGDDEQRRARVEAGEQRGDVGAIDVGDEMHGEVRQLPGAQRPGRHPRPEVGAADADIDDVGDAFAGKAAPLAAVHAFAEVLHALEHGANLGRLLLVGAQGHVADGALLGMVDRLAGQHLPFPAVDVGGSGEVVQQGQCFDVDALLGEVEQQAVLAQRKALEAVRVGGEQLAQMQRANGLGVYGKRPPGRSIDEAHSQTIRPVSSGWISDEWVGKTRMRYSSLPQSSGVSSSVYSASPLSVLPEYFSG